MHKLFESWRQHLSENMTHAVDPEGETYISDVHVDDKTIPIIFDSKNGIGAVPLNSNVNYMGFVLFMQPKEYLGLNPTRRTDTDSFKSLEEHLLTQEELRIAPPWIQVEWDEEFKSWNTVSHEGRGRMIILNKLAPDIFYPIHVFPRGMRARHMTDEMLWAKIFSDYRRKDGRLFSPMTAILNGEEKNKYN